MITPQVFMLPIAPSVNELTFNVKPSDIIRAAASPDKIRRVPRAKTSRYKTWITAAGWELNLQKIRAAGERPIIEIAVNDKMLGDCDNRMKATQDLLVTHRLINDDRYVWKISVERDPTVPPGRMRVTLS